MVIKDTGNIAVVILAAGLGTRMQSAKAKVLHELAGKTLIGYVVETAAKIVNIENVVVVVGHQAGAVCREVEKRGKAVFANQPEQQGTGHAVWCALSSLPEKAEEVLILCGDVPFLSQKTLQALIDLHRRENQVITLLSVRLQEPTGYGRIVTDQQGNVRKIVEEADASAAEKKLKLVNAGIYCVQRDFLQWSLSRINANNAQKEFYLTDIIEIACIQDQGVGAWVVENPAEVMGINSLGDLARAEAVVHKMT